MKSRIIEIYALLVCFCAVTCLMIATGTFGYAIFKIAAPELTMETYEYNQHQNNAAFWKDKLSCGSRGGDTQNSEIKPDENELTRQRLSSLDFAIQAEKREGIQSVVQSLIFILSSCIVLAVHAMMAIKSRH